MDKEKEKENLEDAKKYVWMGSIPLQIHLHSSEVTTLPPPQPFLVLGARNGYLPLLTPYIKPYFRNSLPPGTDTVWFEYKGLPLKWYIPIGVLFDILCADPERPWNITVHFRGYPSDILSPCESEDNVKWNFMNSLKEASYVMNGSIKSVMNMSQSDQMELWCCVVKGDIEGYSRISRRLRPGAIAEDSAFGKSHGKALSHQQSYGENDFIGKSRTGRIPVRLYLRDLREELDDPLDALPVHSWDEITYINRPVEIPKDEGLVFTLGNALGSLLPDLFANHHGGETSKGLAESKLEDETNERDNSVTAKDTKKPEEILKASPRGKIDIIRVQGIEPNLDLPFDWVAQNLVAPEHFLHICIYTSNVGI